MWQESLCVCGEKGSKGGEGGLSKACKPNFPMQLNVSHGTEWVSLHPGLRWPGVPGLRVEVNGQVGRLPWTVCLTSMSSVSTAIGATELDDL